MPQITESAYTAVREAFQKALPRRVNATWVMSALPAYRKETSAKSLVANLQRLGLVDAEGTPTDVAVQWRVDESYPEACEVMLRKAFPADIVDAVGSTVPDSETLVRLFMQKGLGEGSARNLARVFRLLASKQPPDKPARAARSGSNTSARPPRTKGHTRTGEPPGTTGEPPASTRTVLRYFLERGRLAELSVPADMTARERHKLFAHLRIDLLDEVDTE